MTEPRIIHNGRTGWYILREFSDGCRQFWAAKHGEWVGGGYGNWRTRSRFRSIEAAEIELKRIKHNLTPEVPKRAVAAM